MEWEIIEVCGANVYIGILENLAYTTIARAWLNMDTNTVFDIHTETDEHKIVFFIEEHATDIRKALSESLSV